MKLPVQRALTRARKTVAVFGGIDRRPVIREGEWRDMKNMTGERFPTASVRRKRGKVAVPGTGALTGLSSYSGAPVTTRGSSVTVGGVTVDMGLTSGLKDIVISGAFLFVFPDRKYLNLATLSGTPETGSLDGETVIMSEETEPERTDVRRETLLYASPCDETGAVMTFSRSVSTPQDPENGAYWYDLGTKPGALKQYRADTATWALCEPLVKLSFTGDPLGLPFAAGETVFVDFNVTRTQGGTDGSLKSGYYRLEKVGESYFVIKAPFVNRLYDGFTVTLSRRIPQMDFVTEAGNRLWGCRHSTENGVTVNEIYASALGDFTAWNTFEGISTDSYAASVGTDGPFTGAATFRGQPVFFKERAIHRVMGTSPSTFRIVTAAAPGAARFSHASIAAVGSYLYYNSPDGVARYSGSSAEIVSRQLGEGFLGDAAGGEAADKYIVRLSGANPGIYVFDPARKTWHREDGASAVRFCRAGKETYFFGEGDEYLTSVGGTGTVEPAVQWSCETGELSLGTVGRKSVSRLTVRMKMEPLARASFFIEYDGVPEWVPAGTVSATRIGSFSLPIRLRRCDTFRLRAEGEGDCMIYSVTRTEKEGSERD